jgi:lipopolysaccharide transport system ATP-binding protein
MNDATIRIDGLWKRYGLPMPALMRKGINWLHAIRNPQRAIRNANDGPWALRDINLNVQPGESLGIIGPNGAGKSTLLKVLAGVTPPTLGRVEVRGRLFPMIELNAGLHTELTGRENVRLLGSIMGLSREEVEARIPEIEDFCELGEWFNCPVRKYSSGMLARLGFAVAMSTDADVLLVDEVLAVGDITFQRKCFDRMEQIHNSGKTVIFVSHSIRQVERLCDRVLLLEVGAQVACGEATEVISQYYEAANLKILQQRLPTGEEARVLQGKMEGSQVEIVNVRFLNTEGEEAITFYTGEALIIEVAYHAHEPIDNPIIGLAMATIDSFYVSGFTNEQGGGKIPLAGRGTFRCAIPSLPLLSGIYTVQLKIRHPNGSVLGGGYGLATFAVQVPKHMRLSTDYGVVKMEVEWESSR